MEKIIFYHQDSCPQCKMFAMMIEKNKLEVISCKDVEEMKKKGISHTPALEVAGNILYGKEALDYIKGNK